MKSLLKIVMLPWMIVIFTSCKGQIRHQNETNLPSVTKEVVGGGCDGCELMFVGMPETIESIDTSVGWHDVGQKLLISGTVFKLDGKTPASDVIIYYWQTNNDGYYDSKKGLVKEAMRHGSIRGWVKTNDEGKYSIYTIRPGPYPNGDMPAHIHTSIKEPNLEDEYYIDEFVFADDPLLTNSKKEALENRGGSGILYLEDRGKLQVATHDIILGLNIPNY